MAGDNKHQSTMVRKKFRKSGNYKSCAVPIGNINKFSKSYCCTFPQLYKRFDELIYNDQQCKYYDDDYENIDNIDNIENIEDIEN